MWRLWFFISVVLGELTKLIAHSLGLHGEGGRCGIRVD